MKATADDLVGVWRLLSYVNLDEAGQPIEGPLGPSPQGLLIYGAHGYMSVSIMRTDPNHFVEGQRRETFVGYAGRWVFAGDHVLHQVQVSAHPYHVHTEQIREVVLEGDRLTLYGTRLTGERPERRRVCWERA